MGYYINCSVNKGKAQEIIRQYGAVITERPSSLSEVPSGQALICVVDNGPFEAAAYIFDDRELAAFSEPNDMRPRMWLAMPDDLARELSGYGG